MLADIAIIIVGCAIIIALSDVIIKAVLAIAAHLRASSGLIGLTAMSIGTSIPEIMTHIAGSLAILKNPASMDTISGLAIGGNIGSDIFQQNFLFAIIGLLAVVAVKRKDIHRMLIPLIGAAALVLIFSIDGRISRLEGAILVLTYIAYLLYLQRTDKSSSPAEHRPLPTSHLATLVAVVIAGFAIMGYTAEHVLLSAENLVALLPVSASMLGILILGTASALPELATSLTAIRKKQADMSAGILIGSNVTNPLMGIGLGAAISTYTVPGVIITYDLPFKILTAGLIYLSLYKHEKLRKTDAVILLSLFFCYLMIRFLFFPVDL